MGGGGINIYILFLYLDLEEQENTLNEINIDDMIPDELIDENGYIEGKN